MSNRDKILIEEFLRFLKDKKIFVTQEMTYWDGETKLSEVLISGETIQELIKEFVEE